jgi:ATP-dependent DNA helicase RecG
VKSILSVLDTPIKELKGIGEKKEKQFIRLGTPTIGDLLRHYPFRYEDWTNVVSVRQCVPDQENIVKAMVLSPLSASMTGKGTIIYKTDVTDGDMVMKINLYYRASGNSRFFAGYCPFYLKTGTDYLFKGKVNHMGGKINMESPVYYEADKAQEAEPVYHLTSGVKQLDVRKAVNEAIKLLPDSIDDPIPTYIRKEFNLCTLRYALENIHQGKTWDEVTIAKRRLVFEELLIFQLGLMKLRNQVKTKNQHVLKKNYTEDFEELLPFTMTSAQKRAVEDACIDMSGDTTMNRLLQGDVGSGKTAVAAAVCYNMIRNGFQAALMAPTEILARQHFSSLSKLLEPCKINVVLLTGSVKGKERKSVLAQIKSGEAQLVVGTHALIADAVEYHNLGLVITDEQHRFGVNQRSQLEEKAENPHTLVMSATPIPRTLALKIYADLDVSVLNELPPGRQEIQTVRRTSQSKLPNSRGGGIYKFIEAEILKGRQAYIICPLIDDSDSDKKSVTAYAEMLKQFFPEDWIGVVHGKMKPAEKDKVMSEFAENKIKILVSTTVVEVGVDVPNATIMMIENADLYGLSQLHQLRGRVGRGQYKSYCILVSDAQNESAQTRLKTMCDLSDGFEVAKMDLKLRKAGDFFGIRQHGDYKLEIADIYNDTETLGEAKDAVDMILSDDPDLKKPEHKALLNEVKNLFNKNGSVTF